MLYTSYWLKASEHTRPSVPANQYIIDAKIGGTVEALGSIVYIAKIVLRVYLASPAPANLELCLTEIITAEPTLQNTPDINILLDRLLNRNFLYKSRDPFGVLLA